MFRLDRGMSQTMLAGKNRRRLSTGAEIQAWRYPVGADRFRAGCFGWQVVRIIPGWISPL